MAAGASGADGPRRRWPLIVLAGVLAALVSAAVVALVTRDEGSTDAVTLQAPGSTSTTARSSSTTSRSATTVAIDPRQAFFTDLDVILLRSSQSRGQLSDALDRLSQCVDPAPVAVEIRQIEDARSDEIAQVQQLDPPDPETQSLVSTLLTALSSSRDSDATYYGIVAGMSTCAPVGAAASQAEASDQAASTAKRAFVAAYNPMAATYGVTSNWTEDQI